MQMGLEQEVKQRLVQGPAEYSRSSPGSSCADCGRSQRGVQKNCWKKMELSQQVVAREIHHSSRVVEEVEGVMEVQVIWQEESKEEIKAEELKEISGSNRGGDKESRRLRQNL